MHKQGLEETGGEEWGRRILCTWECSAQTTAEARQKVLLIMEAEKTEGS